MSNGKGSRYRPVDGPTYRHEHDRIFGGARGGGKAARIEAERAVAEAQGILVVCPTGEPTCAANLGPWPCDCFGA